MKKTYISIGQKTEKTLQNPYGWKRADYIDENEIAVLILGGNGTDNDKRANGYAGHINELLEAHGLKKNVKIYAVMYRNDTEGEDYFIPLLLQKRSREVLLEKYGRNKKYVPSAKQLAYVQKAQTLSGKDVLNDENPEISNPEYIDRLFEKTILYRISENGQKLPVEEAQRRIRKLNIVAHCHGAYVFLKLEEIMQQKLKDLGYTPKEASDIQKQLLCVAYAPYAPLGVSKSTMISFASAKDTEIWHQNTFHQQIRDLNQKGELNFSYFPDKKGDIFVAPSVIKNEKEELEHNFSNCISPYHELTKDGQNMLRFSRNAIVNGIKSSILNIPLGNIQSLVCGENLTAREIFQQALENGLKTYQNMLQYAKTCKHRQMAAKAKQHPSL